MDVSDPMDVPKAGTDMNESSPNARTVTFDPETGELLSESSPPRPTNVVTIGELPTRCTATNRSGNQCGRSPIPGGSVCYMHGGAAPQVRSKAAERITHARDLALERLIEFFADDGDIADPKVLLDSVVRLTDKVELLGGRATARTEVDERRHYEQVRLTLEAKLSDLAARNFAPEESRPTLTPGEADPTEAASGGDPGGEILEAEIVE